MLDSNPGYVNSEWPGFQDFLEDLAEDLVCHVTAVRAPPIIHSSRPDWFAVEFYWFIIDSSWIWQPFAACG
ncbi:hypothetical protein RRG08_065833 [Elysia crispata]|uniref:Uncharacterized protein n=1 Tax=Elysia crispata TaxID=231223 RepID=A0AAE1B1Z4_9GAST|nr:hypothetical protein RRG08_065833 [Elysia crispata]